MAMDGGSVAVADDGTASGTGLAKAFYDAELALMSLPSPGSPPPGFTAADVNLANLAAKRGLAVQCNARGQTLVTYAQAHAVARVKADATGDGVQAGTTHPVADHDIPVF